VEEILHSLESETKLSPAKFNGQLDHINRLFDADTVEDILVTLEKELSLNGPGKEIASEALKAIKSASPLSVKIVFEQLKRGKAISLRDAFRLEYRLSQHMMDKSDFYEGVRALLIDKDKKPKWDPPTLDKVTDELVASYFAPLEAREELDLPVE